MVPGTVRSRNRGPIVSFRVNSFLFPIILLSSSHLCFRVSILYLAATLYNYHLHLHQHHHPGGYEVSPAERSRQVFAAGFSSNPIHLGEGGILLIRCVPKPVAGVNDLPRTTDLFLRDLCLRVFIVPEGRQLRSKTSRGVGICGEDFRYAQLLINSHNRVGLLGRTLGRPNDHSAYAWLWRLTQPGGTSVVQQPSHQHNKLEFYWTERRSNWRRVTNRMGV